jgi:hypothetical protein
MHAGAVPSARAPRLGFHGRVRLGAGERQARGGWGEGPREDMTTE